MRGARLLIALGIALFGIISYYSTTSENPITGEKQHITPEARGRGRARAQARAADGRADGGLSSSPVREQVRQVGARLVARSSAARTPYQVSVPSARRPPTVNAFALPGGQIFITEALLGLLKTEDELAGVLGHEVGHVLAPPLGRTARQTTAHAAPDRRRRRRQRRRLRHGADRADRRAASST